MAKQTIDNIWSSEEILTGISSQSKKTIDNIQSKKTIDNIWNAEEILTGISSQAKKTKKPPKHPSLKQKPLETHKTIKRIADYVFEFVNPTIVSPVPEDVIQPKPTPQKPLIIQPKQTRLTKPQLLDLDDKELSSAQLTKEAKEADLNKVWGSVLERIYVPTQYQVEALRTGKKPDLTAGKIIGGTIDDLMMATLLSGQMRIVVGKTPNILSAGKHAVLFAGITKLLGLLKEEGVSTKDILASAGLGAVIGVTQPTVSIGTKKIDILNAKKTLFDLGFKESDFQNIRTLDSKFRRAVFIHHPHKGGKAQDFMNLVDAYNKVTSAGIQRSWKLPDIMEWLKHLWRNAGKSPKEKDIILSKADADFVKFFKKIFKKSVGKKIDITEGERTPEEVVGEVIKRKIDNTPEGQEIIKNAVDAQKKGKNILIGRQKAEETGVKPPEAKYKKGDITKLENRLNDLIGYTPSMGEHWKREYHIRNAYLDEALENAPADIKKQIQTKLVEIEKSRESRKGGSMAAREFFADLEVLTGTSSLMKIVEMPEMVKIAKNTTGKTPTTHRELRGALEKAYSKTLDIELLAEIFKYPKQAAKILAHGIGHIAGFLPQGYRKKTSLVGYILSLNNFLKRSFGNLKDKEIRIELKALSYKWRPLTGGIETAYRRSSSELYADAVSVLLNDPTRLQIEAPTFWSAFFEYLDRKPTVKQSFFETWDLINQGEEKVLRDRDKELSRSFETGEEVFAQKLLEKEKRKTSLWYNLQLMFDDKNIPYIRKVRRLQKQGKSIPDDLNPEFVLHGLDYLDGKLRNYFNDLFQPIYSKAQEVLQGWETLGKIVFFKRVIKERGELANPLGHNPETARKQLKFLEQNVSKGDWNKLKAAEKSFRIAVQKVVKLAEDNEYYTPDLIQQMKMNPAYATYQIVEYLDTYISPHVYQQIGTLKDIANPATATVMKLMSVVKGIERNNSKKTVINFDREFFPADVEKAKTRWNGKSLTIQPPKDRNKEVVITIEKGKPQGYYVPKDEADLLRYVPNKTLEAASQTSRILTGAPIYRALFTGYRLGFFTFNFVRDFARYWKVIPDRTLAGAIFSLPRAIFRYTQAVIPSAKRALDMKDELITEMQNEKILGLTHNDLYHYPADPELTQIERIVQSIGLLPKKKKIYDPLIQLFDFVGNIGTFIETLPKVAGYIELKGSMPKNELAEFVRNAVGSPNFRIGGTLTPVSNNILLYSNAIKEGLKTDLRIATTKNPSRTGYWWKTVISDILPTVIMAAVAAGYFGKKLKEIMDKATEYDKTNYTIIPLGIDKNGKAIYQRRVHDESGRLVKGLFWKMLNLKETAKDREKLLKSVFDIFSFGAGQFPNLTPSFTGADALITYLSGRNPYDKFRGEYIIPETVFRAGFKRSFPYFLRWLIRNQGLGIILPSYKLDESATELQKTLNLPVVSDTLGRWIKVTDYGEAQKYEEYSATIRQEKAEKSLRKRELMEKAVEEFNRTSKRRTDLRMIEKQLVKDIVGKIRTSQDEANRTRIKKEFRIMINREMADPLTRSLIYAETNDEKVYLLQKSKEQFGKQEYKEYLKKLRKSGIISGNVFKEVK